MIRLPILPSVIALLASIMLCLSQVARADQFKDFGAYQMHYSIIPTSLLNAQVAKQYDLVRSQAVGIVTVSLLKKQENGTLHAVNGQVQGQVANDIQQRNTLGFRRITEGESVYFIAEFQFREGDLLTFNITANAPGDQDDMPLRVSQTLFN